MGRLDVSMELGVGELRLKFEKNEEYHDLLEKTLRKSPIWNKYAEDYANKYAAEGQMPLKQEYFAMIEDLCDKVMDEDEAIHKNIAFLTLNETIFNESFIAKVRKEFAQELEEFEKDKAKDAQ